MQQLEEIIQKEMSRKEFLATVGFGVASLFGFSAVLKFLFNKEQGAQGGRAVSTGYGSSTYGGSK